MATVASKSLRWREDDAVNAWRVPCFIGESAKTTKTPVAFGTLPVRCGSQRGLLGLEHELLILGYVGIEEVSR